MVVSRILLFSTKKPGERIQCDVSHIFFRLGWELGTSTTNFPPRPTLPKMPTFRRSGMVHGAATPMIFRWQRDILNSSNQRVGVEKSCRIPIKGGMSEFIPRFQVSTNHMDFFAALDGCENVRFFFSVTWNEQGDEVKGHELKNLQSRWMLTWISRSNHSSVGEILVVSWSPKLWPKFDLLIQSFSIEWWRLGQTEPFFHLTQKSELQIRFNHPNFCFFFFLCFIGITVR